jgi:hypothetical protein
MTNPSPKHGLNNRPSQNEAVVSQHLRSNGAASAPRVGAASAPRRRHVPGWSRGRPGAQFVLIYAYLLKGALRTAPRRRHVGAASRAGPVAAREPNLCLFVLSNLP